MDRRGQSIVEVILAVAVLAIGASSIVILIMSSFRGTLSGGRQTEAIAYVREAWEASTSIGETAYNKLRNGTWGLSDATNRWEFSGASDTSGDFTRTVTVEDVNRDGSGDIVTSGGSKDIHTKKVTTVVTWMAQTVSRTLTFVDYLTNWDSRNFFHDLSADWNAGTFSSTEVSTTNDGDGAVVLSTDEVFFSCLYVEGSYDNPGSTNANDVSASGNYAYFVTESNGGAGEFRVVDVSTPSSPTLAGSVELTTNARAISISGTYAYVATTSDTEEFMVFDIATPTAPAKIGSLNLTGNVDAQDVVAAGTVVYLTRSADGGGSEFFVIDVSTPTAPTVSGSVDLGNTAQGVAYSGNYAYAVTDADTAEFQVIDVSVPTAPSVVATLDTPTNANGRELDIDGTKAYVVTDNSAGSEFFVINISTPTLPTILGSVDLTNGATTVKMDGTTAFVGTVTAGRTLQIVDASTPALPVLSDNLDPSSSGYNGLFYNGTRLFGASLDDAAELQVFAIPGEASWNCIEQKGTYNTADTVNANGVYVVGTTMYGVTASAPGHEFFIIDVSTPTSPTLIGSLELGAGGNDVIVSGNYAYIASTSDTGELTVVNISTPSAPVIAGAYNAAGATDGAAINLNGTKALLVAGATLYELDITTPTAPSLLGLVVLAGNGFRVEVLNSTYAYVSTAGNAAEVQVVNYSGVLPLIAGSYDAPSGADGKSLWIKGTQLFLTTANSAGTEFYLLSISTPTAPALVGSLEIGGNSFAVAADNDETFAFAADASTGIRVIDIAVPATPVQTEAATDVGDAINDFYFLNDYLYLASSANALEFSIYGKHGASGGGGGSFVFSGTFESSVLDAGQTANWNTIEWSEYVTGCATGDIQLQVRTATTSGGLSSELWQGPDGIDADETDYFTDLLGELVHTDHNGDQYAQYRATLSGDSTCTQELTDITLTYTPY